LAGALPTELHHPEQSDDRGLVSRDRIEVAHESLGWFGGQYVSRTFRLRDPSLAAAFLAGHREYPATGLCWLLDRWKPGPAAGWAMLFCSVGDLLELSLSQSHLHLNLS
jgi:hypothetical protein